MGRMPHSFCEPQPFLRSSTMPTSAELIADVASEAAVAQKDVKNVIEALTKIAAKELKKNGVFKIPFLANFKQVKKAAREGGLKKCFGKEFEIAPKPASSSVKVVATKNLISSVSR